MNLIARIQNGIDNLFVTKDGLYDQAQGIIKNWDSDEDGVVDTKALGQKTAQLPPDDINRVAANGFFNADERKNGNGYATAKEVRSVLEKFDVDGNKSLEGLEVIALIAYYRQDGRGGAPTAPGDSAATQADAGVEALAA